MKFKDFEKKYGGNFVIQSSFLELNGEKMSYLRRLLSEWKKKKWILELKKGIYVINRDFYKERLSLYSLANLLYFPSYISLETALSFYNLIPEGVFTFTSVSTKKTNTFQNELGNFVYASLKNSLFFGYEIFEEKGQKYLFATKEKALLDFLYLNLGKMTIDSDLQTMYRFQNLGTLDQAKIKHYLSLFANKKLTEIVKNLLQNDQEKDSFKL